MSAAYYNVMAFILLFPWTLLALAVLGHLRARWLRRGILPSFRVSHRGGRPGPLSLPRSYPDHVSGGAGKAARG